MAAQPLGLRRFSWAAEGIKHNGGAHSGLWLQQRPLAVLRLPGLWCFQRILHDS